jgi:hypothetical protein
MGDDVTQPVKQFHRTKVASTKPFSLDGQLFHAVGVAPGGLILDFGGMTSLSEEQQALLTKEEQDAVGKESLAAVTEFLNTVIVPNDKPAFHAAIRQVAEDGSVAALSDVMEIAQWLAEEYAANPTGESSPPSSTEEGTAPASSGGRPSAATTYSRPKRQKPSR